MRSIFKRTLMLLALVLGCTTEPPTNDDGSTTLEDELPDQYTWLVDHGVALSCDEARQVDRGEILWDKVTEVLDMDPGTRGFITKHSFIRVLHPRVMAEYKAAVDALPAAQQSDPMALADIRARLRIYSALTPFDNKYDLQRLERDPATHRLAPAHRAAPPVGCELPVLEEVSSAALIETEVCTEPVPDPGTGTPSTAVGDASRTLSNPSAPNSAPTTTVAADTTPVCSSSCKVTCDLAVAVDAAGDDEVVSKRRINYDQWKDGSWESDTTAGDGEDRAVASSRHRYFTSAVTCRAEGCEKDTWKANVSPGNLGDGTMAVNISGTTDNPDMRNGLDASCTVAVNALAKTTFTMDKNAEDCGAANKNPSFDHKSEILYAVHSEAKDESSSEVSGSVGLTYESNQNVTTGGNANIKASGAGKDGLKIDGVDVAGQAQAQQSYSASGKVGSSYAFRRAKYSGSKWQSGATTLDFLDQINGPPSLTLTNECAQKTLTYKYDLDNFRSVMAWDVGWSWSQTPLCTSRIQAKLPKLPSSINFTCTYSTSSGGGNVKDCTGKLKLPQ